MNQDNIFSGVVGNPPYTVAVGSGNSVSIYPLFFELSYELGEKSSIISPARWMTSQNASSKRGRDGIIESERAQNFRKMFYVEDSSTIFKTVEVAGGVSWWLHDRGYHGETEFIIDGKTKGERPLFNSHELVDLDVEYSRLLDRLVSYSEKIAVVDSLNEIQNEFLRSGYKASTATMLEHSTTTPTSPDDCKLRIPRHGWRFLPKGFLTPGRSVVPDGKYAMVFTHASHNTNLVLNDRSFFLSGGEAAKATMAVILDTPQQVYNLYKYSRTKFFRRLVESRLTSHDTYPQAYQDIPAFNFDESDPIDWSLSIPEIDNALERHFKLEEVHDYIQGAVGPFAAVPEEEYLEKLENLGIDVSDVEEWY